ncbi:MAG: glycoside hydrolase family 127 protein [Chloroflexi bacterium]|nr:glycoside hydrolase family 127 protein [Chloroflexota bacterium]MCC6893136.1 glycoside hydrolase family 127 protein [Anaerolineae bacterium]
MSEKMIQAKPFDLKDVRLSGDNPFTENMARDKAYLLDLDPDRFLHTFRLTAGLPTSAEPYGGWEQPTGELRGHSFGHYLSACALMYASTGDEVFKQRVDYIVAELAKVQAAMPAQGYNAGFLSAYPEEFFDRVDQRRSVWAPYYTLHKIVAGLLDAYTQAGNAQALEVLEKLADWLDFRIARLTSEEQQIALLNEFGGMNESLANLYAITGNPKHLKLSMAFNDAVVLDKLARQEDLLDRMHANTQIPKAIGTARQYELTGDEKLKQISAYFWERVALHRSYAIGGHSDDELFFPVNTFDQHLSSVTAETCNTYNMLKLTRHIFGWEPSAQAMDFYERALFNHILGSQDPKTGMMTYFASLRPGHVKVYNTPHHSFWCCTGTGMENHAKYADTIYYHDDSSLYVNLFIASELTWAEKGITLRQETAFPESDTTILTVNCQQPAAFALKVRYPAWAQGFNLIVNGEAQTVSASAGSYVTVEREWQDGDRVEIRLPMSLQLEDLPNAPHMVAVLYGPIVLAGALGTADMPEVYNPDYHTREAAINRLPVPPVPVLSGGKDNILAHIKPVDGQSLTFRTEGIGQPNDVELIPFFRLHHQRYTVYWRVE